eukprot:684666-Amphidinium_carterae.1
MTRPQPKAPPQGVRVPTKEINKMTIHELREAIREVEDQPRPHGYYVDYSGPRPPPPPGFQKWKDRLEILTSQRQEEEDRLEHHLQMEQRVRQQEAAHFAEVQARRQAAAEKAERE